MMASLMIPEVLQLLKDVAADGTGPNDGEF
jgi:hypothetical protein